MIPSPEQTRIAALNHSRPPRTIGAQKKKPRHDRGVTSLTHTHLEKTIKKARMPCGLKEDLQNVHEHCKSSPRYPHV